MNAYLLLVNGRRLDVPARACSWDALGVLWANLLVLHPANPLRALFPGLTRLAIGERPFPGGLYVRLYTVEEIAERAARPVVA